MIKPESQNVKYLKGEIEINGLDNIVITERAAWSCKRRMRQSISDSAGLHSLVADVGYESIEVQADTIDGTCREFGTEKPDFVKLDVESAEIEALRGRSDTIKDVNKIVV